MNLCFLVTLLTLGGTVSIWVNFGMPNTSRALALRKSLWGAQTKLNGVGELIAAKWRVILASQFEWILREMKSSPWIFPAFTSTLDAVEKKAALLAEWIDIAYELSVIREQMQQSQRKMRLPPTGLRLIEDHCNRALEPLETGHTNADELQNMRGELAAAQALLKASGGPNQMLEQEISEREARLRGSTADLRRDFPEFANLIDDFETNSAQALKPPLYADRDTVSTKILILKEFRDCIRRATPAPVAGVVGTTGALERLEQYRPRLLDFVRADTYEALCMARRFLDEMHQDIYPDALLEELSPEPRLSIVTEPRVIEPGAPVRCSLRFHRDILNDAVARHEWTCIWDFGDGSQPRTGWSVFHTFPEHGTFNVQVKLLGLDARPIEHLPITATPRVDPARSAPPARPATFGQRAFRILRLPKPHAETMLEASRLALVLAAAVLGLIATAEDKIHDMTFLQAAAAVFALGFGADTLKNLVLRRS